MKTHCEYAKARCDRRCADNECVLKELVDGFSESEQIVDHTTGQVAYAAPSEKQEPDKRDRLEIMMDLVAANKRIYDLEGQLREAQAQREGWMKAAQSLIL